NLSAREQQLVASPSQLQCSRDRAGNDVERLEFANQGRRQRKGGAAGVENDRVTLMNVLQCGSSDRFLLRRLQIYLFDEGDVKSTSVRKNRTSVRSLQQSLLLQIAQILTDSNLANREAIGKVFDLDRSCFLQQLQDLSTSRFSRHR